MYNFTIPQKQLTDLWRLREYAGYGPIAHQVRQAVSNWIKSKEEQIGVPIENIEEASKRHKRELRN